MEQFKKEIKIVFEHSSFYSLTGKPEILDIEYKRVASWRNDKQPFKSFDIQNDNIEYTLEDFWLSEENIDDGLDLFSISIK